MRQALRYIPYHEGPDPFRQRSTECVEEPTRVWTLYASMGLPEEKPELPIVPRHHHNAFLEDHFHDWRHEKGRLVYYSRIADGGVWVLLEFDEKKR
jgi:hypothetical protein